MPRRRPSLFSDPNDSRFASSALLSVFFGLAAGAVGMLMAFAYGDIPVGGPGSNLTYPVTASLRPNVEYPAFPTRDLSRSAVRLYSAGERVARDFGTVHLAPGALGAGIVLTSDGWVISHENALVVDGRRHVPETAVIGDRSYAIVDVVEDAYSGAIFLRLDGADLPVTPFGNETSLNSGDQLFGLDVGGGVQRLEVLGTDTAPEQEPADIIRSSERKQRFPRLSQAFGLLPGAILTDGRGDVVAVYGGDGPYGGTAVPIASFLRQVSSVLRNGEVSRPHLGVQYIDLSRVTDAPDGRDSGALLSAGFDGRLPAVSIGSPAASAGLKGGDIIVAVNGERVSRANPLPELIAEYGPGEQVVLSVERNEQAISVEVTLGDTAK